MIEYIRIAVCFAAGIYLSERVTPVFAVFFFLSLILVLTVKAIFKHKFDLKLLVLALAFTVGVSICAAAQDASHFKLSEYEGRFVTITGRVSDLPSKTDENAMYVIDAREIRFKEETADIHESLVLSSPDSYEYGDTVTMSGFIEELPRMMNENSFNLARYYKSKNIFFKMYSENTEKASYVISDYSPRSLALYLKCFISDAVDRHYKGDYAAILKAVLAGNKKEFSPEFDSVLERTGLKRFYYPAFLHVMLFMSLITAILSFANRKTRDIITVFLLIIYALFNFDGSVSLKLCIMLSLFIVYRLWRGHVHFFDVIGSTAIIMGIINPLVYFEAGFVMSMLSSILIYYFYDSLENKLMWIRAKYVRRLVTIGIICSVGLIPVTAYFWNGVTFHSIFVSFLMLPCVTVILVLSPLTVALLAIFSAAPVAGWITTAMTAALYYIPVYADNLQTAYTLPKTTFLAFVIFLLLAVALVKFIKNKKSHMLIALFAAAALTVSFAAGEIERLDDIELIFVNVGQGDGAVVRAPYRFNILIDGGGGSAYSDYNPGEKLYLEYLKREGITDIDSAFVSHYHKDHVQGIIAAIENLHVRNVFMPDNMEGSEWRGKLEAAAKENGTKIHYLTDEILLRYNNGMTIQVIPPARKTTMSTDENDTTYVYYLKYGDFSAMYTGDMSQYAEKCLLDIGKVPHAELLKVAHHGSRTATCAEWVRAVNPLYSVISVGENNQYYLPNDEVLENLKDTVIYRTDYDGDIRFTVEKSGVKEIETFDRRKK